MELYIHSYTNHGLLVFAYCSSTQRQDTDERLRRLQTDKESLALQVQVLTEQVTAQGEKIGELERVVADKTQLLHNTEDLLQRVSTFAHSVGIQIDKQKVHILYYYFLFVFVSNMLLFFYGILCFFVCVSPAFALF